MSVTVYFQAVPGSPDLGNTTITITQDDPERFDYLKVSEAFFKGRSRSEDAAKFEQASRQKVDLP